MFNLRSFNSKHSASCKGTQGASDSIPITNYFSQPGTFPSHSSTTSATSNVTTSNSAINLLYMEESSSTSVMNIVSVDKQDCETG